MNSNKFLEEVINKIKITADRINNSNKNTGSVIPVLQLIGKFSLPVKPSIDRQLINKIPYFASCFIGFNFPTPDH